MKKIFKIYSGFPLGIYILFFARIINSAGSFVFPFMTLYLTSKMGLSEREVGFYVMLSSIASIPGNFIGGALADKFGRKAIFVSVQIISAALLLPCAFLDKSMLVPWLIIFSNVFANAARPVNSAMVSDLTSGEERRRAQSFLYLGINIGFAIGPIISGFLFKNHTPWIFIGDALTTLLAMTLVIAYIKETKPDIDKNSKIIEENENPNERAVDCSTIEALLQKPILITFCFISSFLTFVYSQHTFSLPMYMNNIFGDNGAKYFGMLMTTNAVVVLSLTTLSIYLTRNFTPIVNTALAGIFYAIGFGMLYFTKVMPMFVISTAIWTVGEILVTTNVSVYINSHTPSSHRGRFNAILPFISYNLGNIMGPLVIGNCMGYIGMKNVWVLCSIIAVSASVLLWRLYSYEKRKDSEEVIEEYSASRG